MKVKWILASAILVVGIGTIDASVRVKTLCQGFLPENKMNIPVGVKTAGGITQEQFNQVMDRMEKLYSPEIERLGGKLKINRLWSNGTVNASANRSGTSWVLNMYGGLARHAATNFEGMALVACHEMGHHLGGAPKYGGQGSLDWASNEGQADYYSALKCLRRFFAEDDNKAILANMTIDPLAEKSCVEQFANEQDQLLCKRTSIGGQSVAMLFKSLSNQTVVPQFGTPDPRKVQQTNDDHPATQCRMDTFFAGMRCPVDVNSKLDESDYRQGSCYSPHDPVGFRPACWFAAN